MTTAEILREMERLYAQLVKLRPYTKPYDALVKKIHALADIYNTRDD